MCRWILSASIFLEDSCAYILLSDNCFAVFFSLVSLYSFIIGVMQASQNKLRSVPSSNFLEESVKEWY